MPTSPFQRAAQGEANQPEGRSGSRSSRRLKKQNVKERYMKTREDAQLLGLIPTVPEGAVRDEVAKTSPPPQPELVEQAIKRGWAVPEEMKEHLVQEMIDIVQTAEEPKHKIAAFRALQTGDKDQYERDHPTDKASATGPLTLNVQVVNVDQPAPVVVIPQEGGGPLVPVEVVPSADGGK